MEVSVNSEELEIVRVLVVDDHMLFAEGTVSLLSVEPRILVIGIAKNGIECLDFFSKAEIDVVLLDIKLPDTCGTDLIDRIIKVQPEVKILMLTGHNPKGYITKSISKGANGFLLKECSVKELIHGILEVSDGGAYFSPGLGAFLHPVKKSDNEHFLAKSKMSRELLTPKEIEVIELITRGLHNKEIASTLGINVRTVEYHVSNILHKFGVSKRLEAVLQWAHLNKKSSY